MPNVAEAFLLHTDFSRDKGSSLLRQNIILSSSDACNKTFTARSVVLGELLVYLWVLYVSWARYFFLMLFVTLEFLELIQLFILLSSPFL